MLNFIGPNIGVCVGVVTCEQAFRAIGPEIYFEKKNNNIGLYV